MHGRNFPEEQKTPWFDIAHFPSRPGYYEMREKGSAVILDGRFENGKWSVAYGDPAYKPKYELLKVAHSGLEWRGLIAELPIPRFKEWKVGTPIKWTTG